MVKPHSMDVVNEKSVDEFMEEFMPPRNSWKIWQHPETKAEFMLEVETASGLSTKDFDSCFDLIQETSSNDYKKSKDGWKPRSKRKEMKLLDLKYFLVKNDKTDVEGFLSFMPTHEDDYPVVYIYEIHLSASLQGTGLAQVLMDHLELLAVNISSTEKIMLTCFLRNKRALAFYKKLGFSKDEFSPAPKELRNGTLLEPEYVILSKSIVRDGES